jgi:hypothetical protein
MLQNQMQRKKLRKRCGVQVYGKADLHVHTIYSRDSIITKNWFIAKSGLTAVAVTVMTRLKALRKVPRRLI